MARGRGMKPGEDLDVTASPAGEEPPAAKVQLIITGRELVHKKVSKSGKSGRVYLPLEWVGKTVKVVRVD